MCHTKHREQAHRLIQSNATGAVTAAAAAVVVVVVPDGNLIIPVCALLSLADRPTNKWPHDSAQRPTCARSHIHQQAERDG